MSWPYDPHEDASPPGKDVVEPVSELSAGHELVRLRLPVRVGLADDQTRDDFMTALHTFYLKTKDEYPVRMPICRGYSCILHGFALKGGACESRTLC